RRPARLPGPGAGAGEPHSCFGHGVQRSDWRLPGQQSGHAALTAFIADIEEGPARPSRVKRADRLSKSFDMARSRLTITGLVFAIAFAAVGIRLVDVSVLPGIAEPRIAAAASSAVNAAGRGDIVDRNGLLLATTLPSASLY